MRRLRSTIAVLASVPLLLAAMAPAALAQYEGDPNVGTWVIDAEVDNPDNALSLSTLNADGTLRDRTADGTGAGVWEPTGENGLEATILYQLVDPEGTFFGFVTVRTSGEVSEDGQTTSGTYTIEFPDGLPAGMFPPAGEYGPADFTGTKVSVESIGETVGPWPLPPPEASASAAAEADAEEDDLLATTFVTGTLSEPSQITEGVESRVDGVTERRGWVFAGGLLETDDPRLTGSVTSVVNGDERIVTGSAFFVDLQSGALRIENDGGAWTGSLTSLNHGRIDEDPTTAIDTAVLTGEGAYDGLSAYLLVDATEDPAVVQGAVFAGEMTPAPDPVPPQD